MVGVRQVGVVGVRWVRGSGGQGVGSGVSGCHSIDRLP